MSIAESISSSDKGPHEFAPLTLFPYRNEERWMFDVMEAERRVPQPLGLDLLLDELTKDIPNARGGVMLTFSIGPTGTRCSELKMMTATDVKGWILYQESTSQLVGFASPATLQYFPQPPKRIFVSVEPL